MNTKEKKQNGGSAAGAMQLQQNIQIRQIQIDTLLPVKHNIEATIALLEKRNKEDDEKFGELMAKVAQDVGKPKDVKEATGVEETPAEDKVETAAPEVVAVTSAKAVPVEGADTGEDKTNAPETPEKEAGSPA